MASRPTPAEPSPEAPIYTKFQQRREDGMPSNFWGISCDEGWRSLIVCTDCYERVADWLLILLDRKPFPGEW